MPSYRQRNKALQEEAATYRALVEQAADAIVVHDDSGRLIDVNQKACDLLGFTREELLAKKVSDIDPEATLTGIDELWIRILAGEQLTFESHHRRKDGGLTPVEVTLGRVTLPSGPAVLSTVRDVSHRREHQKEYRQLIDGMNDTAFVIGFDGKFLEVNDRAVESLGYSRRELLTMGPTDIDPFLTPVDIGALIETMPSDTRQVFETQHRAKNGQVMQVEISSSLVSYHGTTAILSIARDITERKQADEALGALTQRNEAMLETIPDIIAEVDANKIYTWANKAGRRFFGEEMIGKEAAFYFEGEQDTYTKVEPLFEGQSDVFYVESWQRRRDGEKRLLAWWCRSLEDDEGNVTGALSTARDITERKALEESLGLAQVLVNQAGDLVFWFGPEGDILFASDSTCRRLGYERQEMLRMTIFDIDPSAPKPWSEHWGWLKQQGNVTFETIHRTKEGIDIPVEVTATFVEYEGKEYDLSVSRDITERKRAEELLELRARQQTAIATLGQHALASTGLQALMRELAVAVALTLDVEYCEIMELRTDRSDLLLRAGVGWREGLVGRATVDAGFGSQAGFTLESDSPLIVEDLATETRFRAPALLREHDVVSGMSVPIAGRDGPYGVLGVHTTWRRQFTEDDIHFLQAAANILATAIQRRDAEEALRQSEARNRQVFDASPDAIFLLDADGRYLDCNQTAVDRYGYSRAELLQLQAGELTVSRLREQAAEQVRHALQMGTAFEWQHQLKDGAELPVEVRAVPVNLGSEHGVLSTVRDLTERKRAEEERERLQAQLHQAGKMESVGRLAGGVAHDFNNMLGVILGHAELALAQVEPSQPLYAGLQEIRKAADHSARITQQLLAFARRQIVAPKVLDLNEEVEGILTMLRRLIGEDINLIWSPGGSLGRVKVDPSQIDQILANLCVNARDAIAGTGTISIETSSAIIDESFCAEHEDCVPGEYLLLTVSDDGRGMDSETISHLFEPFFTTKEVGKGTGLGLATVYGIAKQNNGFVDVRSRPDQGTSFTIYLPRYAGESTEDLPRAPGSALPRGGGETVLLVEDETALLALTETILTSLNYRVLAARLPSEALLLAETHPNEIALLVTDVVMPEMNGEELAKRVRALQPQIKTVFMSGYAAEAVISRGIDNKGVRFLQKPFPSRDLATAVRELLDQE